MDYAVRKRAAVGDAVGKKSDYSEQNYKTGFKIWMEDSKLPFEHKNIKRIRPPLESTPVGTKMSDAKTPATDSSARKLKAQKEYVPEDPESVPDSSESSSRKSD